MGGRLPACPPGGAVSWGGAQDGGGEGWCCRGGAVEPSAASCRVLPRQVMRAAPGWAPGAAEPGRTLWRRARPRSGCAAERGARGERAPSSPKTVPPRRDWRPGGACGGGERREHPAGRRAGVFRAAHPRRGGYGRAAAALSVSPRCLLSPHPPAPAGWSPLQPGFGLPPVPTQGALSVRRSVGWCPSAPLRHQLRLCLPAPDHLLVLGRCILLEMKKRPLWSGSLGFSASAYGMETGSLRRPVCPSWASGTGMAPRRWKQFFRLWYLVPWGWGK